MPTPLASATVDAARSHRPKINQDGKHTRHAQRNQAIRARFLQLHHQQRLRLDDVYRQLMGEFFLSERTIERILRHPTKQ